VVAWEWMTDRLAQGHVNKNMRKKHEEATSTKQKARASRTPRIAVVTYLPSGACNNSRAVAIVTQLFFPLKKQVKPNSHANVLPVATCFHNFTVS
jgi:hypothetical protein